MNKKCDVHHLILKITLKKIVKNLITDVHIIKDFTIWCNGQGSSKLWPKTVLTRRGLIKKAWALCSEHNFRKLKQNFVPIGQEPEPLK